MPDSFPTALLIILGATALYIPLVALKRHVVRRLRGDSP